MELEGIGEFVDSSIGDSPSDCHLHLRGHLYAPLLSLAPNTTVTQRQFLAPNHFTSTSRSTPPYKLQADEREYRGCSIACHTFKCFDLTNAHPVY
jgi:hypothetical protein